MSGLKNNDIFVELCCGDNFGYVLKDAQYLDNTEYKVIHGQNNIFVPCMKTLYNGKTELYYLTDEYSSLSVVSEGIEANKYVDVVLNILKKVIEVENNGFLKVHNLDISADKIFVDRNTLETRLVYVPTTCKLYESVSDFDERLRDEILSLTGNVKMHQTGRFEKLLADLVNRSLRYDKIYERNIVRQMFVSIPKNETEEQRKTVSNASVHKLVAINSPYPFEILLDKQQIVIGKNPDMVDVVIEFNASISRKHCTILNCNNSYFVFDEGSTNGTYINDKRIPTEVQCPVEIGDYIRLSDCKFQLI